MKPALVLLLVPPSHVAVGSGSAMATWESSTPTPIWLAGAAAGWHVAHIESSACGPPLWAPRPAGGLARKLIPSWHEPHARWVGLFLKVSAWGTLMWHLTQLRTSCGLVMSYGAATAA